LQDRQVVAVSGGPIVSAERVRQDRQPLAQQGVDLLGAEPVADLLQPAWVIDGGEGVVQRGESDPGLRGLPLRPVVAVETFSELSRSRTVRR
jgi:hypothetical protein